MSMQMANNAKVIWDAVRHLPYFKVMTIIFDDGDIDIEIEASGNIGSSKFNQESIVLLISRGMQEGASLLVRQYVPDPDISLAKLVEPDDLLAKGILDGTPLHCQWVQGALLVPEGCVPMPADALEEAFGQGGNEGKIVYTTFVDCR